MIKKIAFVMRAKPPLADSVVPELLGAKRSKPPARARVAVAGSASCMKAWSARSADVRASRALGRIAIARGGIVEGHAYLGDIALRTSAIQHPVQLSGMVAAANGASTVQPRFA